MTNRPKPAFHTVEDEWLAAYCAGGLSAAKRLVLTCQAAINPALSKRLGALESLGGVLLESAKGETLSDNFISNLFEKIKLPEAPIPAAAETETQQTENPKVHPEAGAWVPAPLIDFLERRNTPLKWKNMGFGLAKMPLIQEGREKLYLLKAKAGMKMPLHSHRGEEWALILQGGYHVGADGYVRGDVHREDESCTHRPIIDDDGEACITLVAAEGGVKFSNPAIKILQPLLGI